MVTKTDNNQKINKVNKQQVLKEVKNNEDKQMKPNLKNYISIYSQIHRR